MISTKEVVSAKFVEANRVLKPHQIQIVPWAEESIDGPQDIRDDSRTFLQEHAPHDGTLHMFVVRSAYIDGRSVNGFHHRTTRAEFVVVSIEAPASTLPHEIGHTLGLPHVEDDTANIMCGCRHLGAAGFSETQGAIMRPRARAFLNRAWANFGG